MTFAADTVLQSAVNETVRKIRTGEFQMGVAESGLTLPQAKERFRAMVCDEAAVLLDCAYLQIDVRKYKDFDAGRDGPTQPDGSFKTNFAFDPGAQGDVVLMRAFYAWKPIAPGLGEIMQNMSGGRHLLQATAAVRNEPYPNVTP